MAKIYGLFGAMTGKLADTVMSVRNGEQLARKYQPIVFNPSTPAQVAQRAKLKLLSQLSAIVAPAIAIPRRGSVSSRNLFTKMNFPAVSFASETASIDIPSIKLTNSVVGLPPVLASNAAGELSFGLQVAPIGLDRVVYVALARENDNTLRYAGSLVVTEPGESSNYSGTLAIGGARDAYVLAYGVRDNTDNARAKFGDIENLTATVIAQLIVTRTLTESDVTLTETQGVSAPLSTSTSVHSDSRGKK